MIVKEPSFRVVRKNQMDYKKGTFIVIDPLVFHWKAKRCVVTVDTGAFTNFASIPFGFRNIFDVNGNHRLAALVHDYLYWLGGVITTQELRVHAAKPYTASDTPLRIHYTRQEADQVFYELMLADYVPKWQAKIMYGAVRVFGRNAWGTK